MRLGRVVMKQERGSLRHKVALGRHAKEHFHSEKPRWARLLRITKVNRQMRKGIDFLTSLI